MSVQKYANRLAHQSERADGGREITQEAAVAAPSVTYQEFDAVLAAMGPQTANVDRSASLPLETDIVESPQSEQPAAEALMTETRSNEDAGLAIEE